MKIKELYNNMSPKLKMYLIPLIVTYLLFVVLLILIFVSGFVFKGGIHCFDFGGGTPCNIFEFIFASLIYFIEYSVYLAIPVYILCFIIYMAIIKWLK